MLNIAKQKRKRSADKRPTTVDYISLLLLLVPANANNGYDYCKSEPPPPRELKDQVHPFAKQA